MGRKSSEVVPVQDSEGAISQIKTPQELVHIRHGISLLQYKYWILMLRRYRQLYESGVRLKETECCYLPMVDVSEAIGYMPKTSEVEKDLEKIRQEPIIYNILQKDGQTSKRGHGFISEWHVSSNRIGVVLPLPLREAVENLDNRNSIFHILNWNIFNSFSGKYEAILYKLCKDFSGVGWTKEMSIESYREYMGVDADEYSDFKRLNQWTISGPIKKINASDLSDIEVEAVFKREKRRVVSVQFRVRLKRQSVFNFGDDLAFRFAKTAIPSAIQQRYLALSDRETIEYSILRANEYAEEKEKKGEAVDLNKVYAKAITEGWGIQYKIRLAAEQERASKAVAQAKARAAIESKKAEKTVLDAEARAKGDERLSSMDPIELESLFEQWKADIRPAPMLCKKGVDAPSFRAWARNKFMASPT